MSRLWTTVTSEQTITHDAGEPEWLDLPLEDHALRAPSLSDDLPLLRRLDPTWLVRSKWMMDEGDIGHLVMPLVEYRDPLGVTLYQEEAVFERSEVLQFPRSLTTEPYMANENFRNLRYAILGLYTLCRSLGRQSSHERNRTFFIADKRIVGG